MFGDTELMLYNKLQPDKSNPDPWNPKKIIKCSELSQRYADCVSNITERSANELKNKCKQLKRFSVLCFKLEKKYFLEAVSGEIDEESYLDLYVQKQLRLSDEPKSIWKMRGEDT